MDWQARVFVLVQRMIWFVVAVASICPCQGLNTAFAPSLLLNPPTDGDSASSPIYHAEPKLPTAQSPAPAANDSTKWPRTMSPSMQEPLDGPTASAHAHALAPSYPKSGPVPDFPASAPRTNSQITTAHVPVSPPARIPAAAPPYQAYNHANPVNSSIPKGSSPLSSPVPHKATVVHRPATAPIQRPPAARGNNSAMPPATPNYKQKNRQKIAKPPSFPPYSSPSISQSSGPVIAPRPIALPEPRTVNHHPSPPFFQVPSLSPGEAPSPSPLSVVSSRRNKYNSPILSPHSYPKKPKPLPPESVWVLPPPPPNLDCNWLQCSEPLTNPAPGSPCVCVLPIKVGLCLSVTLYTFFPSVSEFAKEIASGINMKLSQVRIMGANVATKQPEKTTVLIDLVPFGERFDNSSAFLAYKKFWHKQILVNPSLFGNFDVLYVLYPGLPPSPPAAPAGFSFSDGAFGASNNPRTMKPLGVDVRRPKKNVNRSMIALIVLSSFIAFVVCIGAVWLLLLKLSGRRYLPAAIPQSLLPIFAKSSGTGHVLLRNKIISATPSLSSSFATYSGSAKTFTLSEIERATDRFHDTRIIGEGGFGRVYQGVLEDGTKVAVKILKREDQQGEREFLAEVEMLNRLHHRNLVKLIGICVEQNVRCVVCELIPNGSVESHLHGVHKVTAPLDWNARMKIALGAARGLAYLHEDSSPPVIHRDFKSSNILLEDDNTPKVSDFGLARAALNEGNGHISTRVMGTFGYVAPEYAMTGHLLVKSDVYSYGVVLLELLTGRKPVDMLQPQGQENLVTWARPLLTSMDGLKTIIDPGLGGIVPFENAAKVAAIASMCVQPEVSHRPFMGEVVQALKLVCNECDDNKESDSCSHKELSSYEKAIRIATWSALEANRKLSASDVVCMPENMNDSGLFRWRSTSGPQRTGKNGQFWQRLRSLSTGSISDHGIALELGTSLEAGERWP